MKRIVTILLVAMFLLAVGTSSAFAEASSDDNSPKPGEVYTVGSTDIPAYQCWWYFSKSSDLFSCGRNQRTTLLTEGTEVEVVEAKISHWLWSRVKLTNGDIWWVWTADLLP